MNDAPTAFALAGSQTLGPSSAGAETRVGAMLSSGALSGSAAQFGQPQGADLLARTAALEEWQNVRAHHQVWQYARSLDGAPHPIASIRDEAGRGARGINFASQDYLSLASHPAIAEAAARALRDFGPHSAGSAILLGNTSLSIELENMLATFVDTEHVTLFPTGWAAAFGAITALVQPQDHIVIDQLAHASLRQGAVTATPNLLTNRHLDIAHVRELLQSIRARDTKNAVLVVTEGLFSMDSDVPDLVSLQATCHEYGARLLVDVAHDLGALGPGGTGAIGAQGMLGRIDLVMGAFSKSFASNGGFVACATRSVKRHLQLFAGPHMFSNALSPIQAAVIGASVALIRSDEGEALRADVMRNAVNMRTLLRESGLCCMGEPSPIVPVLIGNEKLSRLVGHRLVERSVFVNQVEFPGVPLGASRLRLQLMANHTQQQIRRAATVIAGALQECASELDLAQKRQNG
jgi:glycine C-acetyltransferase